MRVVFLLNSLTVGGSESKIIRLANRLAGENDITVAYLNPPESLRDRIATSVNTVHLNRRGKLSLGATTKLAALIRRRNIDAVFAVNLYPIIYVVLARMLLGNRRIVSSALVNTSIPASSSFFSKLTLYKFFMRRMDRVVFGSHGECEAWCRMASLSQDNCSVLYNGVDTSYFDKSICCASQVADEINSATAPIRIGTVARLTPEKRVSDLVVAIADLVGKGHNVELVIVGDGVCRHDLEKQSRELGVNSRVRFAGTVPDVRPWLAQIDIFALCSSREVFSNAALEAMSMSVPVVLTDLVGAREMLGESEAGLLFPASDVRALCSALSVFVVDAPKRQQAGENARARVLSRFGMSAMIASFSENLMHAREQSPSDGHASKE